MAEISITKENIYMPKKLALFVSAPVIETENGGLILDKKFVSGMALHVQHWEGPITCFIRRGATEIPFGDKFDRSKLDFQIKILDTQERASAEHFADYDLALLSGDSYLDLMSPQVIREAKSTVAYSIEYIYQTRLQIISLDKTRSLAKKIYAMAWTTAQELKRRRAFSAARGLQANGYPAYAAYSKVGSSRMLYLDNRMRPSMFATPGEMDARREHLLSDRTLRLIHSGRLEPLKGAQDLIPIAKLLAERGIDFTLTIYGTGSLYGDIAADIKACGLERHVFLNSPIDFETELVPLTRTTADVFLSCHRQSDPSCTYLETLGCGVPIMGYDNKMWSPLLTESNAGWSVPLGNATAMADKLTAISADRMSIATRAENALNFARTWDFDTQFRMRMEHLANLTQH